MRINVLNAAAVAVMLTLGTSCSQSNSATDDKIQALEQKIAQLENSSSSVTPVNVQATQVADPSTLGSFKFEQTDYNFGSITEGEVIEKIFTFKNEGQAPLVISNITASCGCTSPDWTKTPVKPGEEGFVKVVFNSTAKAGAQAPTVSIQANTSPTVTRLNLRGTVVPRVGGAGAPVGPVKR